MVVLAALVVSACSNPTGVYSGSTTSTVSSGGTSSTRTVTGDIVSVFASNDPNAIVVESSGLAFKATKNSDALTFAGGQAQTVTETNGMSSTALTTGTGSLTTTSLTINLTLTQSQTSMGQTSNSTIMLAFTGQKI